MEESLKEGAVMLRSLGELRRKVKTWLVFNKYTNVVMVDPLATFQSWVRSGKRQRRHPMSCQRSRRWKAPHRMSRLPRAARRVARSARVTSRSRAGRASRWIRSCKLA
jgi:hypothetical protein